MLFADRQKLSRLIKLAARHYNMFLREYNMFLRVLYQGCIIWNQL